MAGGADRLRERAGVEVEQFAYPFGAWNQSVARLVAELGFRAAYTTDGQRDLVEIVSACAPPGAGRGARSR